MSSYEDWRKEYEKRVLWKYSHPRCCYCGHFVPWGSDESTSFGGPEDIDPPDPEYYCRACADHLAEHIDYLPSHWRTADWEYVAATRLGYIRIAFKGNAWSWWHDPKFPLLKDHVIWWHPTQRMLSPARGR